MGTLSRRALLASALAASGLLARYPPLVAQSAEEPGTPEAAFRRLLEGNNRFVTGAQPRGDRSPARRQETAERQRPFAAVLGCSDARVPPEILFDQGIGDLFVLRIAGNVLEPLTLGALEFAVSRFDLPLIVVLGHERCETIQTALETMTSGAQAEGPLAAVFELLRQPLQLARLRVQLAALRTPPEPEIDLLEEAIRANVAQVVTTLRRSQPILYPRLQRDQLRVVGLRYELRSGGVSIVA
ncbi:MAG: carbonic anhydrase [Chloroflexi bacterium]|nr:carbonic anhydrase [Chloroflexota bacterium]GIW11342.1 MAG: carbonic anhydrase [Dehalococcoidia bacterium]